MVQDKPEIEVCDLCGKAIILHVDTYVEQDFTIWTGEEGQSETNFFHLNCPD